MRLWRSSLACHRQPTLALASMHVCLLACMQLCEVAHPCRPPAPVVQELATAALLALGQLHPHELAVRARCAVSAAPGPCATHAAAGLSWRHRPGMRLPLTMACSNAAQVVQIDLVACLAYRVAGFAVAAAAAAGSPAATRAIFAVLFRFHFARRGVRMVRVRDPAVGTAVLAASEVKVRP